MVILKNVNFLRTMKSNLGPFGNKLFISKLHNSTNNYSPAVSKILFNKVSKQTKV